MSITKTPHLKKQDKQKADKAKQKKRTRLRKNPDQNKQIKETTFFFKKNVESLEMLEGKKMGVGIFDGINKYQLKLKSKKMYSLSQEKNDLLITQKLLAPQKKHRSWNAELIV